ncbi:MAG TPA: peptide ABC transporter substrate-binding protein [Anaerolineales bacterium]|nr:peptide ABC transporter substrate-binding protein [Anaerolineales bacterium]HNE66932.1 peptide ABC transporter substrate-binding protein [Anaerolineales bacterium]HNF33376.1 peptide ABC transporter substrate-binding protein [Anaerolineales bacterium]HNJ12113.1 peptide ABC transporter substrate-binding protein [Anaerolineales bacterium]
MKKLRWQILVVAVTVVIVALLLLSQQPISTSFLPEAAPGGIYTEALVGSMGRLNPMLDWNNPADRDINRLIFSGLIRFDSHGLPQPDLAEAWGTSPDGTLYNFSIRSNAVWHDGQPVTSDDVIFTIEMIKSSGSLFPQDIKDLWSQIEIKRFDDKTFQFKLPEPFAPFLDYVTFGVLPKHLLETVPADQLATAQFNLQPIGTGPYKFERLLTSGGQIVGVALAVNKEYYLPSAFIEQIVFRFYPDSASALDAYQQGDVLGVSQITNDVLQQALMEPTLSVYTSRLPQLGLVFLNLNNPTVAFLQSDKVRHALLLGTNRELIVSRIMQGQAIVADGPILPGSWAHYDEIEHFEYDPDAAAALLKAEGYVIPASGGDVRAKDGQYLNFTLTHPDDEIHTRIAQAIQSDWALIGVRLDLQPVSYDSLVNDYLTTRNYQAALADLNTARTPDPDPYLFWHQSEATGGQNYSQWDNRTASEFLESARTEADFSSRARLYRNFQVVFTKDMPSLPLYYPVYSYGVDAQVQGVQVAPMYDVSDRLALVAEWYLVTRRALEEQTPVPTAAP